MQTLVIVENFRIVAITGKATDSVKRGSKYNIFFIIME